MQRYPLNSAILAKLGKMAASSCSEDSEQNLIFDIACLGHFISPRVSKYAQASPKKVDYHVYPSGNKVIKAFSADDFVFFDNAGNTLELVKKSCLDQAHKAKITWHIQKNCWNRQAISISSEDVCHQICPVCAAGRMVLCARSLGQSNSMPVSCHSYKNKRVYLTGKHIAIIFQEAVNAIHPKTSEADLPWYLAHSLRVWACILLEEAGTAPDFIMSCLRLMGNSFQIC